MELADKIRNKRFGWLGLNFQFLKGELNSFEIFFIYVELIIVSTTLFTELKNLFKLLRYEALKLLIFKHRFAFHFRTNYDVINEQPIIIFFCHSNNVSQKKSYGHET